MSDEKKEPFVASVTVGPKGQIVIPGRARKYFGINPGDTLMVFVNPARGMSVRKMDVDSTVEQEIDGVEDYRKAAAELLAKVRKQ